MVIYPCIKTVKSEKAIDWRELAERIAQERCQRPEEEQGSCVFSGPTSVASFPLDSLPPDFPIQEVEKEIQAAAQSNLIASSDGRQFIFAGSRFRHDIFERAGDVFLIEAADLDQASALCELVVEDWPKDGILTEWCPPIYEAPNSKDTTRSS